jgi:hypothetical protein
MGCGCYGELVRGETLGLVTDKGKNPDCITSFTKEESSIRGGKCQANGFSSCALDAYNKCMDLVVPKVIDTMKQQSATESAVHNQVMKQRTKMNIAFHDFSSKLDKDDSVVAKLHMKLEDPTRWTKFFTFNKIPKASLPGTQKAGEHDLSSCENFCGAEPSCKSFSFSKAKGACVWSADTFKYSDNWDLHLKPQSPTREVKFFDIPGMMYDSPDMTEKVQKTEQECKLACYFDENCGMWSHSRTGYDCVLAGRHLHQGDDFDYYEKAPIPGAGDEEAAAAAKKSEIVKRGEKMAALRKITEEEALTASTKIKTYNRVYNKNEKEEKYYRTAVMKMQKAPAQIQSNGDTITEAPSARATELSKGQILEKAEAKIEMKKAIKALNKPAKKPCPKGVEAC